MIQGKKLKSFQKTSNAKDFKIFGVFFIKIKTAPASQG